MVKRFAVHAINGGWAHVLRRQRGVGGQVIGQHTHHGLDHIAVRRHGGGDTAGLRLNRAADLDEARFDGACTAVMVVVLALTQPPLAGAPAHIPVTGVRCVQVETNDHAGGIDQLVKVLAPFGQEQLVVQVVAGLSGPIAQAVNFALDHEHKGLGPAHLPLAAGEVHHDADSLFVRNGAGMGIGHVGNELEVNLKGELEVHPGWNIRS